MHRRITPPSMSGARKLGTPSSSTGRDPARPSHSGSSVRKRLGCSTCSPRLSASGDVPRQVGLADQRLLHRGQEGAERLGQEQHRRRGRWRRGGPAGPGESLLEVDDEGLDRGLVRQVRTGEVADDAHAAVHPTG